jgi:hypothetical protein
MRSYAPSSSSQFPTSSSRSARSSSRSNPGVSRYPGAEMRNGSVCMCIPARRTLLRA